MTTLVLVPGLICDARIWRPVADAVTGRLPVHAADLTAMTGITGAAQDLLDRVPGPLVVAGHSMGGRVAMEMARLAPERMRGLVLANTGHHPPRDAEMPKRLEMIALGHRSMADLADVWLPPMLDPSRLADAALVDDLRQMVLSSSADIHERQIRALMTRPDAGAHMADIPCPVLLITGRQDSWSPVAQHQEIADAVTDAHLVVIEDAGHFAPVERPEDFVAAVTGWLHQKGILQ